LEQVFLDVAQYYDVDCSGDLSASELKRLLNNCGIALHDDQVREILCRHPC
jgi:Ca2+-binding EF-hand superfamily protein